MRTRSLVTLPTLILYLVVGFPALSHAATIVSFDSGTPQTTSALTTFATTGWEMDGMAVTAFFTNSTSETVFFADRTTTNSGRATGTNWTLTETGDSFSGTWILRNTASLGITKLLIDAGAGDSVFDITAPIGGSTPNSAADGPSSRSSAPSLQISTSSTSIRSASGRTRRWEIFGGF